MAMKEQQRTVYRSANGREVDMEKLRNQNELTLAVGNARVNARGDELGPGGQIVRKREDIVAEYYESNPKARKEVEPVKTKTDVKPETKTDVTTETKIEEQSTKRIK